MQCRLVAFIFALANAGSNMAARIAIIAMTTSSSMSVNAERATRAGLAAPDSDSLFIKDSLRVFASSFHRHVVNLSAVCQPVKGFFVGKTTYNILDDLYYLPNSIIVKAFCS